MAWSIVYFSWSYFLAERIDICSCSYMHAGEETINNYHLIWSIIWYFRHRLATGSSDFYRLCAQACACESFSHPSLTLFTASDKGSGAHSSTRAETESEIGLISSTIKVLVLRPACWIGLKEEEGTMRATFSSERLRLRTTRCKGWTGLREGPLNNAARLCLPRRALTLSVRSFLSDVANSAENERRRQRLQWTQQGGVDDDGSDQHRCDQVAMEPSLMFSEENFHPCRLQLQESPTLSTQHRHQVFRRCQSVSCRLHSILLYFMIWLHSVVI